MADPADSPASAAPRPSRGAGSATRRRRASAASSVSAETENKLARAVQSAQRLAQLSDVPRDDSTLDLFPDDPTRALVESMTIDVRQGTLSGFELPAVVRAAVEAAHGANPAPVASERANHEPAMSQPAAPQPAAPQPATPEPAAPKRAARSKAAASAPRADSRDEAAVELADAVAVEHAGGGEANAAVVDEQAVGAAAVDASPRAGVPAAAADAVGADIDAVAARRLTGAADASLAVADAADPAPPASRGVRAPVASSPELDRARATAFADTVDALYGVIADQRRAAADLTRRMKWMLAIVAGALLVTVGVGVMQTLLLSRLARDAAAQQQRTERLLQTQQAALAGVLERVAAPAPAATAPTQPAAAPTVPPAAQAPAPAARHALHHRHPRSPAR